MRFSRRRPAPVQADTTGLTHCSMCGQGVRVEDTGRCVLGHRVFAVTGAAGLDTERPADWADPEPVAWTEPTEQPVADGDTADLWGGTAANPWPIDGDGDGESAWQPDAALVSDDPAPSWATPLVSDDPAPSWATPLVSDDPAPSWATALDDEPAALAAVDAWDRPAATEPEPWSVSETWTIADDDGPRAPATDETPAVEDYAGLLGWDTPADTQADDDAGPASEAQAADQALQTFDAVDDLPAYEVDGTDADDGLQTYSADDDASPAYYEIAAPDDEEADERELRRRAVSLYGGAVAMTLTFALSVVLAL